MNSAELEASRLFFTSLYSKSLQVVFCKSSEVCLEDAEKRLEAEWPILKNIIPKMFEKCHFVDGKFEMVTHPMIHELFDEEDCGHYKEDRDYKSMVSSGGYDKDKLFHAWSYTRRDSKYDVGRATFSITLIDYAFKIFFEKEDFVHGHITEGKVNCWGAYPHMHSAIANQGITAAITMMYNFAKYSRYLTYDAKDKEEYYARK